MSATSSISSATLSTEQQISDRAATFEKVAAGIPDHIDGEHPEILNAAGAPIAPAPAPNVTPFFNQAVSERAMDLLAQIMSGLDRSEITLDNEERAILAEAFSQPANRILAKKIGASENGDVWGFLVIAGIVFGAKSQSVRSLIEKLMQFFSDQISRTIGGNGSTTPDSLASPTAVNHSAQN